MFGKYFLNHDRVYWFATLALNIASMNEADRVLSIGKGILCRTVFIRLYMLPHIRSASVGAILILSSKSLEVVDKKALEGSYGKKAF